MWMSLQTRVRAFVAEDRGYAMVVVMGLIALLTVVAFGGFALAQQSLTNSAVVKRESLAFQAANAGLDGGVADIAATGGYDSSHFPKTFTKADVGSGSATVTVTPTAGVTGEYTVTSVGTGPDGATETVRVRIYLLDLYGMNIAFGVGFNQGQGAAGKFNGNASIYGPFYTMDNLKQGENLGNSNAGGLGWGPVFIQNGTLDVKSGYLDGKVQPRDSVRTIYVDPEHPDPKVVNPALTRVVRSVPTLHMPQVDTAYLESRRDAAMVESSDNIQGDNVVWTAPNTEVGTIGNPNTYTGARCPGASDHYKIIDDDETTNGSFGTLTLGATSFGNPTDDFAYNAGTNTLTVWGTVFIDGGLRTSEAVTYYGNGTLVCNGEVRLNGDFVPYGGLQEGVGGPANGLPNQQFLPNRIVGIATPETIHLDNSSGGNAQNPDGAPTHAGAFFANEAIEFNAKVLLCGSLIAGGIEVTGNNNMDLRTSQNLGANVPRSMPGYGLLFQSIGGWSRK